MQGPKSTVLAVDDSEDILGLIGATLGREHRVKLAPDGPTALRLAFEEPRPDLILLDVEMPDASGYEVCKTLKASPAVADVAVVFLSGHVDPRDVVQGFRLGAVDYLSKPINPPVLAMRVRAHLELIARRNRQDELIRERTAQLEQTRLQLIRRLGRVMEYHETSAVGNRVVRLGHYARALAQAAGARPLICDLIMKAAPLHDIGKVGVPAQLLRKTGALSAPELEQMQRHPEIGAEIIGEHDDPLLKLARTLALTHHERWDGGGYPAHLRGADIPWAGRVMAIVDSFESMTTTQFYRERKTFDQAAREILDASGKQFDPAMVQAFGQALPEFKRILQTYRDQLGDMLNLDFATRPLPVEVPQDKAEIDARSAQAMRDADAERARALAEAQARLRIEHELTADSPVDTASSPPPLPAQRAEHQATVLAVDDSEDILGLIGATLGREHRVKLAPDGPTALRLAFEEPRPDLILLDVEMPDASGYEVCKTLKASPAVADVAVVFLSGHVDPRDVVQGFRLGAVDYLSKPINPPVLAMRVRAHLELIARRNRQDELIRERTAQLEQTRLQLIRRLGRVMEYHETSAVGNRVVRLGHYARALAQAAGARPLICDLIMKAAPLHDIGKVGVPAQLLRKTGALSAPELEQMQRHPEIGAEIIGEHDDPLLKLARTLALTHHERWDGGGYPAHLRGADIPWAGRVMAIVDSFESMTTTQFYRERKTFDQAAREILDASGKQFDPAMVQAFGQALPEFKRILQTYRDQLGDMLNLDFATRPLPVEVPQDKAEIDARSAQAMRDADAERARALAEAYARLQKEHELAAAEAERKAAEKKERALAAAEAERKAAEEKAKQDAERPPEPVAVPEVETQPLDSLPEPAATPEAETAPAEAEPEKRGLDLTLEPVAPEEEAVDLLLDSTMSLEAGTTPAEPERIRKVLEEVDLNLDTQEIEPGLPAEPAAVPEAGTPDFDLMPEPTATPEAETAPETPGAEEKEPELPPEPVAAPEAGTPDFDLTLEPAATLEAETAPETPSTEEKEAELPPETIAVEEVETMEFDLMLEPAATPEAEAAPAESAPETPSTEEKEPELPPEPVAAPEPETQPLDSTLEPAATPEAETAPAESAPETPSSEEVEQRLAEEERAGQVALQAQAENERAILAAREKAAADEAVAARAAWRLRAEESLAESARARTAAEVHAAQAAKTRATAEIAAMQAAQARRKEAAEAAEAARLAAASLERLRHATEARAAAEDAALQAEQERFEEESATTRIVEKLEAAEAEAARTASRTEAVRRAAAQVQPKRPAWRVQAVVALAIALCAAALGYFAHRPSPIVVQALPSRPSPRAVAAPPLLDSPGGTPLVLRLDRHLRFAPRPGDLRSGGN